MLWGFSLLEGLGWPGRHDAGGHGGTTPGRAGARRHEADPKEAGRGSLAGAAERPKHGRSHQPTTQPFQPTHRWHPPKTVHFWRIVHFWGHHGQRR